ncbi:MAG: hypothetical protein RIS47_103 [Bacteroidota bacterium]|jgi:thioredoxin
MRRIIFVLTLSLFYTIGFTQNKPIELNPTSFKEKVYDYTTSSKFTYKGDKPAIIDFYADWCGPCRRIAPVLGTIAETYAGKLYVYKVNVDTNAEVAKAFSITSIPMVLFIPLKGEPKKMVGAYPEQDYYDAVSTTLKVTKEQ